MPYKYETNSSGSEGSEERKFAADKGSGQKWVKVLLLLSEGEKKKEREKGKDRRYDSLNLQDCLKICLTMTHYVVGQRLCEGKRVFVLVI